MKRSETTIFISLEFISCFVAMNYLYRFGMRRQCSHAILKRCYEKILIFFELLGFFGWLDI